MELNEIRERINNLNDEMLALFMERMKLSEAVAAYKKEHKLPILDKTREREILAEMILRVARNMRLMSINFSIR